MATDTGSEKSIHLDGNEWLRQKAAANRLGVDPRTMQRLADYGKIRVATIPEMERGRLYCVRDIDALKKYGVELGGITLYLKDGAPSLSRRIPELPEQALVERLDYCWEFLCKYGMLRGDVAEAVRCNVSYAVMKSKRKRDGQYACLAPEPKRED